MIIPLIGLPVGAPRRPGDARRANRPQRHHDVADLLADARP